MCDIAIETINSSFVTWYSYCNSLDGATLFSTIDSNKLRIHVDNEFTFMSAKFGAYLTNVYKAMNCKTKCMPDFSALPVATRQNKRYQMLRSSIATNGNSAATWQWTAVDVVEDADTFNGRIFTDVTSELTEHRCNMQLLHVQTSNDAENVQFLLGKTCRWRTDAQHANHTWKIKNIEKKTASSLSNVV